MPNVFDALKNVIQSYIDDEPKPPLHVGEVMNSWTYLAALEEALIYEQAGMNTTVDHELKGALDKGIEMCFSQIKELRTFLQQEGVPLPPASEPKPKSESDVIPFGVKLTDGELANGISAKVALSITACGTGVAQSIRNDMGSIWIRFQSEQLTFGVSLKSLMKKRGWLKIPPPYYPPGWPRT